jgi:hypothetical protein
MRQAASGPAVVRGNKRTPANMANQQAFTAQIAEGLVDGLRVGLVLTAEFPFSGQASSELAVEDGSTNLLPEALKFVTKAIPGIW